MMKTIQKSLEDPNTKKKTMTKTTTKTKTHKKCLKTHYMLYFWNPDDLRIPNMMIDTSPWPSCSRQSHWLPCSGHTISSTGPNVSPFRDFLKGDGNDGGDEEDDEDGEREWLMNLWRNNIKGSLERANCNLRAESSCLACVLAANYDIDCHKTNDDTKGNVN